MGGLPIPNAKNRQRIIHNRQRFDRETAKRIQKERGSSPLPSTSSDINTFPELATGPKLPPVIPVNVLRSSEGVIAIAYTYNNINYAGILYAENSARGGPGIAREEMERFRNTVDAFSQSSATDQWTSVVGERFMTTGLQLRERNFFKAFGRMICVSCMGDIPENESVPRKHFRDPTVRKLLNKAKDSSQVVAQLPAGSRRNARSSRSTIPRKRVTKSNRRKLIDKTKNAGCVAQLTSVSRKIAHSSPPVVHEATNPNCEGVGNKEAKSSNRLTNIIGTKKNKRKSFTPRGACNVVMPAGVDLFEPEYDAALEFSEAPRGCSASKCAGVLKIKESVGVAREADSCGQYELSNMQRQRYKSFSGDQRFVQANSRLTSIRASASDIVNDEIGHDVNKLKFNSEKIRDAFSAAYIIRKSDSDPLHMTLVRKTCQQTDSQPNVEINGFDKPIGSATVHIKEGAPLTVSRSPSSALIVCAPCHPLMQNLKNPATSISNGTHPNVFDNEPDIRKGDRSLNITVDETASEYSKGSLHMSCVIPRSSAMSHLSSAPAVKCRPNVIASKTVQTCAFSMSQDHQKQLSLVSGEHINAFSTDALSKASTNGQPVALSDGDHPPIKLRLKSVSKAVSFDKSRIGSDSSSIALPQMVTAFKSFPNSKFPAFPVTNDLSAAGKDNISLVDSLGDKEKEHGNVRCKEAAVGQVLMKEIKLEQALPKQSEKNVLPCKDILKADLSTASSAEQIKLKVNRSTVKFFPNKEQKVESKAIDVKPTITRRSDSACPPMIKASTSIEEIRKGVIVSDAFLKMEQKVSKIKHAPKPRVSTTIRRSRDRSNRNSVNSESSSVTTSKSENVLGLAIGDTVWAKAGNDAFWPGRIHGFIKEREDKKVGASIIWYGVDTYSPFVELNRVERFVDSYENRFNPRRTEPKYHRAVVDGIMASLPAKGYFEKKLSSQVHRLLVTEHKFNFDQFTIISKRKKKVSAQSVPSKKQRLAKKKQVNEEQAHSTPKNGTVGVASLSTVENESVSTIESSGVAVVLKFKESRRDGGISDDESDRPLVIAYDSDDC